MNLLSYRTVKNLSNSNYLFSLYFCIERPICANNDHHFLMFKLFFQFLLLKHQLIRASNFTLYRKKWMIRMNHYYSAIFNFYFKDSIFFLGIDFLSIQPIPKRLKVHFTWKQKFGPLCNTVHLTPFYIGTFLQQRFD